MNQCQSIWHCVQHVCWLILEGRLFYIGDPNIDIHCSNFKLCQNKVVLDIVNGSGSVMVPCGTHVTEKLPGSTIHYTQSL